MDPEGTILVWGAGGHGRVVADLARALGYSVSGYIDRDAARLGHPVDAFGATMTQLEERALVDFRERVRAGDRTTLIALGIGDNAARLAAAAAVPVDGVPSAVLVTLVHPSASVGSGVDIGAGSVVFPNATVNAGARLGRAVIINSGAIVEHDCTIGDGAHVSPGAVLTGGVAAGPRSWIGAGAVVLPGVVIGARATVGAGAVVLADVEDGVTVVGNPARALQRRR